MSLFAAERSRKGEKDDSMSGRKGNMYMEECLLNGDGGRINMGNDGNDEIEDPLMKEQGVGGKGQHTHAIF